MSARNTTLRYGSVAMTFHWVIALLVIANICVGLYMGDLPRSDPMKFEIFQIHKSIGLTVLVLSILRVVWRLMNPVPPLPAGMNPALKIGARISHFLLYFLIVAIPLTGYIMVSASPLGNGTSYFGLFDWPNLPIWTGMTREQLHPIHETWETVHVYLAWSAIVLIPIHVLAALYHGVMRRDGVLSRMVPGTTVGPAA
ncbi:MAG TPA: cytochrome b [Rhizomicrobium sp.]|nr:cytochrome b [Rhizomicrobium sp.]